MGAMKVRNLAAIMIGVIALAAAAGPMIVEYAVPAAGAFPHDTAVDGAGRVYFTEMNADKLGRFDPESGTFSEFKVPSANSEPHGIVVGPDGIVSFTEISADKIGRFDPAQATFHEYPTGNAQGPHTPVVTPDRQIYFTAPGSDAIGRLDSASGAVATYAVPTVDAVPYGIKSGPDGALYFTEFGSNKIGRFDLQTHLIKEFVTPTAGSAPRRLWFWKEYAYFTEFGAGKLGRLDIGNGVIKEWPSPGGSASMPYGIVVDKSGQVWYEESGTGAIIHFDPAREVFVSIPLPLASRGAMVRNMDLAPDGRIWIALSGVDRIGVLRP
jgi:virginiamycin B lyase